MYTPGQVIGFIEKAFGTAKLTNAGLNANVLCPVCHERTGEASKKKLAIRTDNWVSHCWVCGYKSKTIIGLIHKYKPYLLEEYTTTFGVADCLVDTDTEFLENTKLTLPRGFQLLAEHFYSDNAPYYISQAKAYLLSRGLGLRDFWYWKFGVTIQDSSYHHRVVIPSFDEQGELNFFTSRSYKSNVRPKYFNPTLDRESVVFNELNIDWTSELTLVEGPFDLVKCNDNATCLLGKELHEHYRLFQQIALHKTPVVVALDVDAKQEAMNMARLLLRYGVTVKLYNYPPGVKDPGEMSRTDFVKHLELATVLGDDDYLLYRLSVL